MATISEILANAIEHHQAGRLKNAELLYRQILQVEPNHADALHLLGVTAHQVGNHAEAIQLICHSIQAFGTAANVHNNLGGAYRALRRFSEAIACYRRAIELKPDYAEAQINLGNALSDLGNVDEALSCYRRAVELKPNHAKARIVLGNAYMGRGQFGDAITCYRRALELQPDDIETCINLGNAWKDQGNLVEAIDCYRRTIELNPDFVVAHLNLGVALKEQGRLDEAIDCYRRVLELNPGFAEAHNNLGVALYDQEKRDEAVTSYRRALELKPDYADAYVNLGNALNDQGELDAAINCYQRALELRPEFAKAHCNLGATFKSLGKLNEAANCYRRALELKPDYADAHNDLGAVLKAQGKLDEAVACCHRALALKQDYPEAYNHLGNVLKDQGKLEAAVDYYQRAIDLKTDYVNAHSNLLYTRLFCPGYDRRTLLEQHRRWNEDHATPLASSISPHHNDQSPDRRLRIGYVSPDFRNHVVGRNLVPLFQEHDHQQFEIICYSDVPCHDELTKCFKNHADVFRDTKGLSDLHLTQCIRYDRVDILVDLTLHMALNRLLVFARKPAPIQVTFAGYPGTTGLTTIDYRLTDRYLDPPGLNDDGYSEESIRLPDTFWCYDPLESDQAVNDLPATKNGYVTFGCLNNFCKINEPVLKMWATILKEVDNSRLMILAGEGSHRQQTLDVFAAEGIAVDRVTFVGNQPRQQYLKTYHEIDIGLDTVPYNGHSTSLDSYWMGVPVVTLIGSTVTGRAGLSQLTNLGLQELIAENSEHYVTIAKELAQDRLRLNKLRATLRQRMQASPLMDATRFARSIEAAYREIWTRWCTR